MFGSVTFREVTPTVRLTEGENEPFALILQDKDGAPIASLVLDLREMDQLILDCESARYAHLEER